MRSLKDPRKQINRSPLEIIVIVVVLLPLAVIVMAIAYKAGVGPSESVAQVVLSDGSTYEITSRQFQKRVHFERVRLREEGADVYELQALAFGASVLDQMIREILVRDEAAQQGLIVSEEEVDNYIEQAYGFMRFTPTPAPALTATPVVTGTPTVTPTPVDEAGFQKKYQKDLQQWARFNLSEAEFRDIVRAQLLENKLRSLIEKPGWTFDDWLVSQWPRVDRLPLWMERYPLYLNPS